MATSLLSAKRISIKDRFRQVLPALHQQVSGKYLMGRESVGSPIRASVEAEITRGPTAPVTYLLDFSGIEDISASVAEELGPILFVSVLARSRPGAERYLIYVGLSHDVQLGLDELFKRSGRVAPCLSETTPFDDELTMRLDLLGPALPPPTEAVIRLCYQESGITSHSLATVSLAAASKKLTEVFDRYPGLLHREKVHGTAGPRSWRYEYLPVVSLHGDSRGPRSENGTNGPRFYSSLGA